MSSKKYAGKRIIITGTSAGIGAELAYQYSAMGAKVALSARREDKLVAVSEKCKSLGAQDTLVIKTDVSVETDCKNLIDTVVKQWGGIDILILNAGRGALFKLEDAKNGLVYKELMETNYLGCVYPTIYALPYLRKNKGTIVVISSVAGLLWLPFRTAYSSTKHALVGFFNSLRLEVPSNELQITMAYPGFVYSDFHESAVNKNNEKIGVVQRTAGEFMVTKECARLIIQGVESKKRDIVMTAMGRFGRYASVLYPALVDKFATRAATKGLKHENVQKAKL